MVILVGFLVACQGRACGEGEEGRRSRSRKGKFERPRASERRAAVGVLWGVKPALRVVFEPAGHFDPIDHPGKSDWLANHHEPGQTYRQFVASRPNRPTPARRTIYLQPIGAFAPDRSPAPKRLVAYARVFFQLPAKLLAPRTEKEVDAKSRVNRHSGKRQLLSTDILDYLKGVLPRDGYAVIAVTQVDLYPSAGWNFVFGQAALKARVGVYSFARYHPGFYGRSALSPAAMQRLVLSRSLKVMVHELGHQFGLWHCIYYNCVMNGSNHLEEDDSRPAHFCPVCLRKLHDSIGFDPRARYRELEDFYRRAGLTESADWVKRRLAWLARRAR